MSLVALELVAPFVTSQGVVARRRAIIIRLHTGSVAGWGECGVMDELGYSPETIAGAWEEITRRLIPALRGTALDHPSHAASVLDATGAGPMARAGVEAALWDGAAHAAGVPLSRLLGGSRHQVAAGIALGRGEPEDVVHATGEALAAGYGRVKLKVGTAARDIDTLRAVRAAFPNARLAADANGAFAVEPDAVAPLDDLGLEFIEQPLAASDLEGHARLRRLLRTPLCLDESIRSAADARAAITAHAASIFNLRSARVGGHTAALAVHAVAVDAGIALWHGGLLETGIGRAHNVALASLSGFTLPGDLSASSRYFRRDLVAPPWVLAGGHLVVPEGPGLGVEVDEDYLEAVTVRRVAIG